MRIVIPLLVLMLALLPAAASAAGEDFSPSVEGIATGVVNARTACHDPSIIAANGKYYIFGSHMAAASSENLRAWTILSTGYYSGNIVWGDIFAEGLHVFDYAGSPESLIPTDDRTYHVWAPDVVWNEVLGKYMMYYCTTSTWNASNICFGVSDSVEGPYEWQDAVVYSGFDKKTVSATDAGLYADEAWIKSHYLTLAGTYNYREYPNAIDPSVFFDENGRFWMVYGSWSGGIYLLELDPRTGKAIHPEADPENDVDPYFGKRLLGGNHQSIEGPYILYDAEAGWYYLFVSYGNLTAHGGYQIRVFRSRTPDGEYEDMNGERVRKSGQAQFGLKLSGNYTLPSVRTAYMATGHNSAMVDADGKRYICYHTRFNNGTEGHLPMVKQYGVNAEGWPCMLPYATRKETIPAAFDPAEVPGRWYVINQGTGINDRIAEPFILYLYADGTVTGEELSGTWSVEEGTGYLRISIGDTGYSGVLCRMQDDAGTDVIVFSAAGANESVWGVRYDAPAAE
ncbi:MAG: glycoside hydrolase family 43 protein [Clostridiales bacterium]|nr:glycoside hydrolase family 43 protein [Clostridiales bacterium]